MIGAAFWHLWQGVNSHARALGTLPVWGFLNEAIWSAGFTPTIGAYADLSYEVNIYRAGQELLTHLTDKWIAGGAAPTVNKVLSAFARAGFFLTPASCLTGKPGDTAAVRDLDFCPEALHGGDAIIDIDDGDKDPFDAVERSGIRLADDDFVIADKARPPSFRIWTGVPFAFVSAADPSTPGVTNPGQPMCNNRFLIEAKVSTSSTWLQITPPPPPPMDTDKLGTTCYTSVPIDSKVWGELVDAAGPAPGRFATIEYRLTTWRDDSMQYRRVSTDPANGMWSTAPNPPLPPSTFFITDDGRAPL
jgi:hypothetical protein